MDWERDEVQRRRDAEEERHFWESIEDDRIAEEERQEAVKASAIKTMQTWFFDQFEDPHYQMPHDSQDQAYLYPYGGPFAAADVLNNEFSHRFEAS